MDSTPAPPPNPNPNPSPKTASARKLPIKRKSPKFRSPSSSAALHGGDESRPPPFKFHRIWTEPDEIRFLQGLLDCTLQGLSFPKDLQIFYSRFSSAMSQPYTKNQLSEKIRRLRKKYRVIAARLARGVDPSRLSQHDRQLFDISKQLWAPHYSPPSSNRVIINNGDNNECSNLVGVKVSFSPTLALTYGSNDDDDCDDEDDDDCDDENGDVNDLVGECENGGDLGGGFKGLLGKIVMDVFDECVKELKSEQFEGFSGFSGCSDRDKLWCEQRVAELDVIGRRVRLVLENSLNGQ